MEWGLDAEKLDGDKVRPGHVWGQVQFWQLLHGDDARQLGGCVCGPQKNWYVNKLEVG